MEEGQEGVEAAVEERAAFLLGLHSNNLLWNRVRAAGEQCGKSFERAEAKGCHVGGVFGAERW